MEKWVNWPEIPRHEAASGCVSEKKNAFVICFLLLTLQAETEVHFIALLSSLNAREAFFLWIEVGEVT